MNRIDKKFNELKRKRKKAFIVYVTAGDPDMNVTKKLVPELEKNGVDLIELGIPFSDPLADGPTIQEASKRALSKRVNIKTILRAVRELRKNVKVPIVFMTYYNPVYRYGLKRFVADSKRSGVDGVIVPDLPYEEAGELAMACRREGFANIMLASPTSPPSRLRAIAKKSDSFIYYVSLTGVTGARKRLPKDIISKIKLLKGYAKKPVCVGFGVSNPAQASSVASYADGVIIGSALINIIASNLKNKNLVKRTGAFAGRLAKAIHGK